MKVEQIGHDGMGKNEQKVENGNDIEDEETTSQA